MGPWFITGLPNPVYFRSLVHFLFFLFTLAVFLPLEWRCLEGHRISGVFWKGICVYIQILFLFHLGLQRLESKTVYLQYHPCNETILSLNRLSLAGSSKLPYLIWSTMCHMI
jgi:hypothetical protein